MDKIISIVIPTLNEEKFIINCLKSVINFSLPYDWNIEIIVADGMSNDNTRHLIKNLITTCPITIIDNEDIYQANGINKAIQHSKGNYIMRLDAHAIYPKDYLIKCFNLINESGADNVGGAVITLMGANNFSAKLVQALTTHPFGVGDSTFRTSEFKGEVDTVPFGFFKKEIFNKIGYFNEKLIRAQDYEFNRRIKKEGGKIFIDTSIKIQYFNQSSILRFYSKQFFKEAPYNAYMWYLAKYSFTIRHAITAFFAFGILIGILLCFIIPYLFYLYIGILVLYFLLALFSAYQQAIRYKDVRLLFILPFSFFGFHFIHGLGVLKGCVLLLFGMSPVQKK